MADEQALVEIEEETSVPKEQVELIRKGKPILITHEDIGLQTQVHSYLFQVKDRDRIRINWEHEETRWIKPGDMDNLRLCPT